MEQSLAKIYEEDFKNQPLYRNKFNLNDKERADFLRLVPDWARKWQEALDKAFD